MAPLLLTLALLGPPQPQSVADLRLVPVLHPLLLGRETDPAHAEESSTGDQLRISAAELGLGALTLAGAETIYSILGFGLLATAGFPGTITGLSATTIALVFCVGLVGAAGLPAITAAAVRSAAGGLHDPRQGPYLHAYLGSVAAAAAGGVLGFLYAFYQGQNSLSGTPETVLALAVVAFQFVAIPVGAVLGLHWDVQPVAEAVPSPPEVPLAQPPDVPPALATPPEAPASPPPAPLWTPPTASTYGTFQVHFG